MEENGIKSVRNATEQLFLICVVWRKNDNPQKRETYRNLRGNDYFSANYIAPDIFCISLVNFWLIFDEKEVKLPRNGEKFVNFWEYFALFAVYSRWPMTRKLVTFLFWNDCEVWT